MGKAIVTGAPLLEAAVRQLQARYIDAVWRKDATAFGACFTEDAHWLIGGQTIEGRDAIVALIGGIFARANRIFMEFGAPLIHTPVDTQVYTLADTPGPTLVTARTYVTERVSWQNGDANMNLGCYFDRVVEQHGIWRFDWRQFQLFYSGPPDLSGEWFDEQDAGPPPGMPSTMPPHATPGTAGAS